MVLAAHSAANFPLKTLSGPLLLAKQQKQLIESQTSVSQCPQCQLDRRLASHWSRDQSVIVGPERRIPEMLSLPKTPPKAPPLPSSPSALPLSALSSLPISMAIPLQRSSEIPISHFLKYPPTAKPLPHSIHQSPSNPSLNPTINPSLNPSLNVSLNRTLNPTPLNTSSLNPSVNPKLNPINRNPISISNLSINPFNRLPKAESLFPNEDLLRRTAAQSEEDRRDRSGLRRDLFGRLFARTADQRKSGSRRRGQRGGSDGQRETTSDGESDGSDG